jgi:hypothetical protein
VAAGVLVLIAAGVVGESAWSPGQGDAAVEPPRTIVGAAAQQGASASIVKDPASANLFLGEDELIIVERIAGVPSGRGLGGYQLRVSFDPNVVSVGLADGSFLRSSGRTPLCLSASAEGTALLSCFSTGSAPGPVGGGILAALTIRPAEGIQLRAASGNGIETLVDDLTSGVELSDTNGAPIPVASVGDAAVLVRALEGDVSRNCRVDVADSQVIAGRMGAQVGSAGYSQFFDLEPAQAPDGDIDVLDLQVVFGRRGSTCDAPNPDQLPPGQTPPVPSPTPTLCPNFDGDDFCDSEDADDDDDGCADIRELGEIPELGGERDPLNYWDYFDPTGDRVVSGLDLFAILARFGSVGDPSIDPHSNPGPPPTYHTRFDRGPRVGPNLWDLAPPDGAISGIDFFAVASQYKHVCV